MSVIEASIGVGIPVHVAYNQWTHFESFPRFMEGVLRVDRPQPTMTHWTTRFGPITREFDAEIVEQLPDQCLSWRVLDTPSQKGRVTFEPLDGGGCRVRLRIEFVPRGLVELVGDRLGLVRRRVLGNLVSFKEFIEGQGVETGQWRGTIEESQVGPNSGQLPPVVPTWPTG